MGRQKHRVEPYISIYADRRKIQVSVDCKDYKRARELADKWRGKCHFYYLSFNSGPYVCCSDIGTIENMFLLRQVGIPEEVYNDVILKYLYI